MNDEWTPEEALSRLIAVKRERSAAQYAGQRFSDRARQVLQRWAEPDIENLFGVLEARDAEVSRLRAALAFYANPENYVLTGTPNATGELSDWAPHVLGDDGERARAALGER